MRERGEKKAWKEREGQKGVKELEEAHGKWEKLRVWKA
jgi:hypothetical protein